LQRAAAALETAAADEFVLCTVQHSSVLAVPTHVHPARFAAAD